MKQPQFVRWVLRLLSYLLQGVALVFVVLTLLNSGKEIAGRELLNVTQLFVYLMATVFLVAVILLVILAYWHSLLSFSKGKKDSRPTLIAVAQMYGRTILAKYIPGNVFHYLGRQVVGKELGFPQVAVAGASIMEVLLLTSASSLVAMLSANSVRFALLPFASYGTGLLLMALMVILPLLAISLMNRWGGKLVDRYGSKEINLDFLEVVYAYAFYCFYVVGNSLVLIFLHITLFGSISIQLSSAYFAAFSISFVVSYLTPGAPGGMGVREALFILLLADLSPQSVSAVVAIAHRFASLGAQVLYTYGVTPLLSRYARRTASSSQTPQI